MWTAIAEAISSATGQPFSLEQQRAVSGGCINQGYYLEGEGQAYFVKLNQAHQLKMFAAEALGLEQIAATQTIRVPRPICYGVSEKSSYLVMEWLSFGQGSAEAWKTMGRELAALHHHGGSQYFGWNQDNTIGSTPQPNPWTTHWATFFAEHRLGYQLHLAQRRADLFSSPERIIEQTQKILSNRNPAPALVHGDLWSGNVAILTSGEPVILDPATYYGDPEVDLAMTELFGGFPAAFYQGYSEQSPLDAGYQTRKKLYNLYHILNHFNLFGGGYGGQAQQMIQQIFSDNGSYP